MKRYNLVAMLIAALSLWGVSAYAQYDDLYYNPDADSRVSKRDTRSQKDQDQYYSYEDETSFAESGYDDEVYDYYYTSRIRRFHRPTYGFGYFDPVYTDMYYYDPFFTPGMTMLIYDSPFSYASWARWNRWAFRPSFGFGFGARPWGYDPFFDPFWGGSAFAMNSPFGFGSPWGWNRWNSFGSWNRWGGGWGFPSYYAGGGFLGGGFGGGLYCPPTWGNGYAYNTPNAVNNTYYGPRTTSGATTTAPRTNIPRTSRADRAVPVEPRSEGVTPANPYPTTRPADISRERSRATDRYARPTPGATPAPDRYSRPTPNATPERSRTYDPGSRSRIDRSGATAPRSRSYSPPNNSSIQRSAPRPSYTPSRSGGSIQRSSPSPSYTPRSSGSSIQRSAPAPSRSGGSSAPSRGSRGN